MSTRLAPVVFFIALAFCLTPWASSGIALLLGVAVALSVGNPFTTQTKKYSRKLLAYAIVGMGAGVNLVLVAKAGTSGFVFTLAALSLTLLLGWGLGKILKTPAGTSVLINVGTAICGGSAIAAVSSAIKSTDDEISVSLGVVFVLNAVALFLFPFLGHQLSLSEGQFGLWSALAIHDTSSVVGATMQYGSHALQVGTTVKLMRALWIIPVTLVIAKIYQRKNENGGSGQRQYPWFILGFLLASAVVTLFPTLQPIGKQIEWFSKRLLVVVLFLIGAGLSRATLSRVGFRPLLHGILLWFLVAVTNLYVVMHTEG